MNKRSSEELLDNNLCNNSDTTFKKNNLYNSISDHLKLILLYFFGYCVIGIGILSICSFMVAIISNPNFDNLESIINTIDNYIIKGQIILDIIFLCIFIFVGRKILCLDVFKDKKIGKTIILILVLSAIFIFGNLIIGTILDLIPGSSESANQDAIIDMIKISPLTIIFSTIIFAPIVEELVFRGGIYKLIEKKFNTKAAILGSGAIFGLLHVIIGLASGDLFELIYFINYFAMGCAFGLLYAKTNNIYICIAVHFINNLVAVILILINLYN